VIVQVPLLPTAIAAAGGMVFWIDGSNIFGIAAP
jgi:hypothetical protein